MMMDPIGDLLTRIRNAYLARIIDVQVSHSKLKESILSILKKNKYIQDYEIRQEENKKFIHIILNNVRITKYIPTLIRVSKPGQRIYVNSKEIKKSRNGKWIYILSTPKWVITGYGP